MCNTFISCLYMLRANVVIIRMSKLYYTASGINTLKQVSGLKLLNYNSLNMSKFYYCDDTSGCVIQF